jgi:hypothetical protein
MDSLAKVGVEGSNPFARSRLRPSKLSPSVAGSLGSQVFQPLFQEVYLVRLLTDLVSGHGGYGLW